jgi:hypothetical protein
MEVQKLQIKCLPIYSIKKARLNTSLLLSRTRNKKVVYFEVSVKDQVKIHENYKIVQSQVNEIDKLREKYNQENPLSQFMQTICPRSVGYNFFVKFHGTYCLQKASK